ncbi:MAG TPA: hypothetical protein DC017_16405 [Candidatus Wallbacteria bacterium]|nr:hypothetical protein [Candidatus Wallbacteria bacterium]
MPDDHIAHSFLIIFEVVLEIISSFIKKINKLSNGSGVNARRFERLKTEIKKLRERAVALIEKINAQVGKLNEEKINLSCLLKELDSSEIAFNKIKILPDEKTSEINLLKK